jgi:hypothetical protein
MIGGGQMVIGIRSFPTSFAYVILDGNQNSPIVVDMGNLTLPKNISWPAKLTWVRRQLGELLQGHEISGACIKTIETNSKNIWVSGFFG